MVDSDALVRWAFRGLMAAALLFLVAIMRPPITDSFLDINSGQIRKISSAFWIRYRTVYSETWVSEFRTPTDTAPDWKIFGRTGSAARFSFRFGGIVSDMRQVEMVAEMCEYSSAHRRVLADDLIRRWHAPDPRAASLALMDALVDAATVSGRYANNLSVDDLEQLVRVTPDVEP